MVKKYNIQIIRALSFIVIFVLINSYTYAGWVITEESSDSFGNRSIQTTFIQNNIIRYETPSSIAIIDLNNKIITIVFSQYKVYWSGTSEDLKLSIISMYDKQLESMLVGLPEYEKIELDSIYFKIRQQLLDSNNFISAKDISIIKTTNKQDINGYGATKYNIVVDSILVESVWHTTEVKPYNDIDISDMVSFTRQLNQISGKASTAQSADYLNLLKTGMLLKSTEILPDSNKFETIVTNIREVDIVSDFFLPPKNYLKVALQDVLNLIPDEDSENID